jgi:hypothetical protein
MDVNGHVARNGQLGGAAFAEHSMVARGIVGADIVRDTLSFTVELGVDPTIKRKLPPASVCNVATGCVPAGSVESPQRYVPVNYLDASVTGVLFDETLELSLGYEHVSGQIGPDGQRRQFFYGPDAKFYIAAELYLDELYGNVTHKKAAKRRVASRD